MTVVGPSVPVYRMVAGAMPSITGTGLTTGETVTVIVYRLNSGSPAAVVLTDDEAQEIGNTGNFRLSLSNLPAMTVTRQQYHYVMTDQSLNTDSGDFILEKEGELNTMPSLTDTSSYLVDNSLP